MDTLTTAFESGELAHVYDDLVSAAEFTGAKAILNAGNQVVHQFSVTGAQGSVVIELTQVRSENIDEIVIDFNSQQNTPP